VCKVGACIPCIQVVLLRDRRSKPPLLSPSANLFLYPLPPLDVLAPADVTPIPPPGARAAGSRPEVWGNGAPVREGVSLPLPRA
jgi:hypothetical protein